MELHNINSPVLNSLNDNNSTNLQKLRTIKEVDTLSTNAVNISVNGNSIDRRSNISSDINAYLINLSKTNTIQSSLINQVETIDRIQEKVTQLSQSTVSQEEVQPNIAQYISQFNSSVTSINEQMSKLEDLKGDSTTYFDGTAGAIPIGINLISNEVSNKNSELKTTLEKVSELNGMYQKEAQGIISKEIQEHEKSSPFKQTDFKKESVDFSSKNMSNVLGSVVSSQANAVQAQSIKLLS
jgi:Tfp pilus assembly protein PilN